MESDDLEKELASLRKLWLILAILCLTVSVNVLIATQGGDLKLSVKAAFGIEFDKDIPEAIAGLWGVIYLTVFVGLASAVLRAHASKCPGGWTARFPFRVFDLPPGQGVGRVAQVVALVILTLTPAWFLGHSWRALLNHGVLCVEVSEADWRPRAVGADVFFTRPADAEPGTTRLTSSEATPPEKGELGPTNPATCKDGKMTDYAAPQQSWIMAAFSLLAAGMLFWSLFAVFWPIGPQ